MVSPTTSFVHTQHLKTAQIPTSLGSLPLKLRILSAPSASLRSLSTPFGLSSRAVSCHADELSVIGSALLAAAAADGEGGAEEGEVGPDLVAGVDHHHLTRQSRQRLPAGAQGSGLELWLERSALKRLGVCRIEVGTPMRRRKDSGRGRQDGACEMIGIVGPPGVEAAEVEGSERAVLGRCVSRLALVGRGIVDSIR